MCDDMNADRRSDPDDPEETSDHTQTKQQEKAVCRYCDKTISVRYLKVHIKSIHNIDTTNKKKGKIFCVYCNEKFKTMIKVIVHLQKIHNHITEKENLQFKHKKDFEEWLAKEESKVTCQYVKRSGEKKKNMEL